MKPIVFGESVQGASHVRSEIECQDSKRKRVCDDGTIIMAVADGHGSKSCPYSKTGSKTAVSVFCKIMYEYINRFIDSPEQLLTYLNREGDTKVAQEIDLEWKHRIEVIHRNKRREFPVDESGKPIMQQVYSMYGTTLLGIVLAKEFLFSFQLGDGDIVFVSSNGVEPVIKGDKILGVETHSLCKVDAWKKAITTVRRIDFNDKLPAMFIMTSDGFSNSYKNEDELNKTYIDYLNMINQYGVKTVRENLKSWLSETSEMGCGDDITVMIAYLSTEEKLETENTNTLA